MKSLSLGFAVLTGTIFLAGCASKAPQKSQLEIREFQTRNYPIADTKRAMKAVLNVLHGPFVETDVVGIAHPLRTAGGVVGLICHKQIDGIVERRQRFGLVYPVQREVLVDRLCVDA